MQKSIGLPFKAELVPKVLDGSKTQTRRLPGIHNCKLVSYHSKNREGALIPIGGTDVTGKMSELDWDEVDIVEKDWFSTGIPTLYYAVYHPGDDLHYALVPRHKPGDIAWMREKHCFVEHDDGRDFVKYLVDGVEHPLPNIKEYCDYTVGRYDKTRASIHMPRWASRWERPLKSVRIELIQDISEEDAIAEGIDRVGGATSCNPWRNYLRGEPGEMDMHCSCPQRSFQTLWDSINASRNWAWELNRPVVVFEWSE